MKFNVLFSLLIFGFVSAASAQVPKKVIAEHFTNTRCGVCEFKNPDFYENLNNQDGILHISFHPSSPYSSCVLNQHNKSENDDRTFLYGIYGATPRFVFQGVVQSPGLQVGDPEIWTPYLDETSPVSIQIEQDKSADIIRARVTLTTEATHSLSNQKLLIALAEDTVFYEAPNGESLHFDVFRKAFTDIEGMPVEVPQNIGESVTFNFELTPDAEWDIDRMFTVAILQEESNEVVQAEAISPDLNSVISSVRSETILKNVQISPNPTNGLVNISMEDFEVSTAKVYNTFGQLILENTFSKNTTIDISGISSGTYIVEIQNEKGSFSSKLVKLN